MKECTEAERAYLNALIEHDDSVMTKRAAVLAERLDAGLREEIICAWVADIEARRRLEDLWKKVGCGGSDFQALMKPIGDEAFRRADARKARP